MQTILKLFFSTTLDTSSSRMGTGVLQFLEYGWSKRFLARMSEDPTWPPWIPMRDGDEAKNITEPTKVNGADD